MRFNPIVVDSDWLAQSLKQNQEAPIRARDRAVVRDLEGTRLRRRSKSETQAALKQVEKYAMAGDVGEARRILESLPDTSNEKRALRWRLNTFVKSANNAESVVAEAQRPAQQGRSC